MDFSVINPWYDKFYEMIDTGYPRMALNFYRESFAARKMPEELAKVRQYILTRLRTDFDIRMISLDNLANASAETSLDFTIMSVCNSVGSLRRREILQEKFKDN